jgi:hypothetical protein
VIKQQHALRTRSGQAMIEYVVIAGMLLATVVIFSMFMYAFKQDSGRSMDIVAYEYP